MSFVRRAGKLTVACLAVVLLLTAGAASAQQGDELVIYSGRGEPLVGPLFDQFTTETGINVSVRYGDTAQLAATILEEGSRTPADVYFGQDAGALGALAQENRLQELPDTLLNQVDPRLRSPEGLWLGTSGRARVITYNTRLVAADNLPDSIWDLLEPDWRGRIGWAPTNGSFQAFVTALRILEGEDGALEWLRGIRANQPRIYRNNTAIVDAVGRGEVYVGITNHYYLYRFLAEQGEDFPARNHYTRNDAGSMMNIAGVGILDTSPNREAALRFIDFLLSETAQQHFANENYEYPVISSPNVQAHPLLLPLADIDTPDIDLSNLEGLQETLELLQRAGVL